MSNNNQQTRKKWSMPSPIVIMCGIALTLSIAGFFIPAGEYVKILNEETGRMVSDPSSFAYVERESISAFQWVMNLFSAIPRGLYDGADIVFFLFLVAGSFNIITATKTIETGIGKLAVAVGNHQKLMIPVLIAAFSIGGATFGMAEENVIFVPICIALARALGYDAVVGMAVASLGAACGFTAGVINPFTIGVAQGIAELPTFSGFEYRLVIIVVMVVVTSAFVMNYAEKVRKNPSLSLVYDVELKEKDKRLDLNNLPKMTTRHRIVLAIVVIGFAVLIYGVFQLGWYIQELASLFFAMGVIAGFAYGFSPNEVVDHFLDGVRDIAGSAIMIGFAMAILIVMQDALIIDTLIHALSNIISILPQSIAALGMYVIQIVINFFIPSGSGQAAATMPIMVPLSDIVGINRQIAVLCYQFGDGFTNSIIPTNATLMALLSLANIPYSKWLKFIGPLMLIWIALGAMFIVGATAFNYGPF